MFAFPLRAGSPQGYTPPCVAQKLITRNDVYVYDAIKTPQFWLIWWVLCLNVTAGIGVLGQASAMSQEMFPGHVTAVAAAGFVGLLSLFNMLGRFFWASTSDIYRAQEHLFLLLRARNAALHSRAVDGFDRKRGAVRAVLRHHHEHVRRRIRHRAGLPKDMFGTRYVGAIHGVLLTAWSAAGVFGPVLVNYIREYQIGHGVPKAQAYNTTMYIMAGLLVIGFICNAMIKAVHERYHMKADDPRAHDAVAAAATAKTAPVGARA